MSKAKTADRPIILLDCDFEHSARVKALGAKWHNGWRMWFISEDMDKELFQQWLFEEDK